MERLMELEVEAFKKQAMEHGRWAIRQIGQAVNSGGTGHVIEDSELVVKGIGQELIRQLFELAVQSRIDSTESSFSPSGRHGGPADAKQGQAGA